MTLDDGRKAVAVKSDAEDYTGVLLRSGTPGTPDPRGDLNRYPAATQADGFHNTQLVVLRREALHCPNQRHAYFSLAGHRG